MFETISGFLWFFIPTLALICVGIVFEDKLVRFENAICRAVKNLFNKG